MWVTEQSTQSGGFVMQLCCWEKMQCEIGRTFTHIVPVNISASANVICKASLQLVGILKVEHMPTFLHHNSPCCALPPAADTAPQLTYVTRAYRKKRCESQEEPQNNYLAGE